MPKAIYLLKNKDHKYKFKLMFFVNFGTCYMINKKYLRETYVNQSWIFIVNRCM